MEVVDLEMGLRFLSGQGHTLNVSEVAMLRASLAKLQAEEKFGRMFFWGKIFGKTRDYYIAYGLRERDVDFPAKQFYCATSEKFEFGDLPVITDEEKEVLNQYPAEKPFEGEPDALLFPPADDEDAEQANPLMELERVAYTVENLDSETSVVPASAYILNDTHQVVPSLEYCGMSYADLCDLGSYAHFRPAESIAKLRAMAKDAVEWKNSNFLDRLTSSLPQGCWAKRVDPTCSTVELRSLLWPGYSFYAVARKPYFGSVYIGHGIKNVDLAFVLP